MKTRFLSVAAIGLLHAGLHAQTAAPVRVPGTKCSLAAPSGFTASKSFSGFQHEQTGAFIMINELPAPLKAVTDGFSDAAMKGRGMTLVRTEQITVRDQPATMFTVAQASNGTTYTKYLLVFGQGDATTLVTAGYPEGSTENADVLKAAIRAIDCNPELSVDPLQAAPFTLDVSGTEFKAVTFSGGSLLYSMDGKIPTDKPVLIVGSSSGKTVISTRKAFAEKRIRQLPGAEKTTISETTEITIDGLSGYEIVATGSGKDGTAALVYEAMLFTEEGKYFVIVGQSNTQVDGLLDLYRKVAKSFKRK